MKGTFLIIILSLFTFSCGLKEDITKKDSPTSGKTNLFYDEGLTLHVKNQIYTFQTTYKYADIVLRTSNEKACIEALYNDSSKVIAISRELTEKELTQFKVKNIFPQTSIVAGDAIAFIVSKAFNDSTISIKELTELLQGNDSTFMKGQHINIVFDNANSGSTRQLKDSLIPLQSFGKNCTALNNTTELIKAISVNPKSIGVCDYAWLSDKDDNTTKEFLKTIKILAVSKNNNEIAYMPDQSNIATKNYPLCRSICIIRRSAEFSLGKGIETFIAGPTGQLMFLKQGLPPNRQEERLIELDMTPLK
jgi:phosphate transport system substrate-binding protein